MCYSREATGAAPGLIRRKALWLVDSGSYCAFLYII